MVCMISTISLQSPPFHTIPGHDIPCVTAVHWSLQSIGHCSSLVTAVHWSLHCIPHCIPFRHRNRWWHRSVFSSTDMIQIIDIPTSSVVLTREGTYRNPKHAPPPPRMCGTLLRFKSHPKHYGSAKLLVFTYASTNCASTLQPY